MSFSYVATGGITIYGPNRYKTDIATIDFGPEILISGTADLSRPYDYVATGGITLAGVTLASYFVRANGGIDFRGFALYRANYKVKAKGGIVTGGKSKYSFVQNGVHDGGPALGGSAKISLRLTYIPTGQILVGGIGSTPVTNEFDVDFEFTWDVQTNIILDQQFEWNIGDPVLRWYQIDSCCNNSATGNLSNDCPPFNVNAGCNQKFITTISATSIQNVCNALTSQGLNTKICSIRRFTTPALLSDIKRLQALGSNFSCNQLEEIDFCHIPECQSLCVDYSANADVYATWTLYLIYIPSGGMTISGSSMTSKFVVSMFHPVGGIFFSYDGSGKVQSDGEAIITFYRWSMTGNGGVGLEGIAPTQSPRYEYQTSGEINFSGSVFDFSGFTFNPLGLGDNPGFAGIYLSGMWEGNYRIHEIYDGAGEADLAGDALWQASHFDMAWTGGSSLSGMGLILSSIWQAETIGGTSLSGEAFATSTYFAQGSVVISGAVIANRVFVEESSGGAVISGESFTQTQKYAYQPAGEIDMGGNSLADNAYKGLFAATGIGEGILSNYTTGYREDDTTASLMPYTARIVTPCDCNSVPTILQMSHGFSSSDKLRDFLSRNNFHLSSNLNLSYNGIYQTWQSNTRFSGVSDDGSSSETWNILFEWQCDNRIGGFDVGSNNWIFKTTLTQQKVSGRRSARMVFGFAKSGPCLTGAIRFAINYQTQTGVVSTDPSLQVYSVTVHDGIGLFYSSYWTDSPNLKILIAEDATVSSVEQIVYQPVFPLVN